MSVDNDTVRRIAKLSRIALDEARVAPMVDELNGIFAWVQQLNEVNVENVPPMTTVAEARDAVHKKKVSSKELTTAFVKAVADARPLNAFVTETPQKAIEMAVASDVRLAHGEARPLEGLPLAIKDLFCTKGVKTTAGSRILS